MRHQSHFRWKKFVIGSLLFCSAATSADEVPRIDQGYDAYNCLAREPRYEQKSTDTDERIFVESDSGELDRKNQRSRFMGNVILQRQDTYIEADWVEHDKQAQQLNAGGSIFLRKPGFRGTGDQLQMALDSEEAQLTDVEYRLTRQRARGTAERIDVITDRYSEYQNITYTTCRPGIDAWQLEAKTLDVDHDTGLGIARHAKFRLKGVPILYTPYLSFPIDDRRMSGFLSPTFGTADETGRDISIPYYLNLAPNLDATVTPRHMAERGLMLGSEVRYLMPTHRGELKLEYLPDDSGRDPDEPVDRHAVSYYGGWQINPRWRSALHFDGVSDKGYLEDFGNTLSLSSTRYLEQRVDLNYRRSDWHFLGRVMGYQTVDRTIADINTPYTLLPQLLWTLDGREHSYGLHYQLNAEYTNFEHADKINGHRLALKPSISLPLRKIYGHLIPRITLYYTDYRLYEGTTEDADNPSLLLPSLSLDSGLLFERNTGWFGHATTQTLEPRLFYLHTPYEDQDDIPVFDSAELGFSFASLFQENRFSGRDRVGDANQFTLALTSRTLSDATGRELLRGSIGQTFYLADRRVQIFGEEEDKSSSSIAAEMAASLGSHWTTQVSLQWDPHVSKDEIEQNRVSLRYNAPEKRIINLSYNYNRDSVSNGLGVEDADFSFYWPVNHKFTLFGRWNYSLFHDQTMERFAGVEYGDGCCWKLRTMYREFLQDVEAEMRASFTIQIEFRGLGAIGDAMDSLLEDSIYGYQKD